MRAEGERVAPGPVGSIRAGPTPVRSEMVNDCENEIRKLHQFLQGWLTGTVPESDESFQRFRTALAHDFLVIHPTGKTDNKARVLENFRGAYGRKGTGYAMDISNIHARAHAGGICVMGYEERHRGEPGRARICTAVFRRREIDGRVEWVHLRETLLP